MPDDTRDLHDKLVELEAQLARTGASDGKLREELRTALDEVRARVDAGAAAERPLLEGLSELMLHLEAEHPTIAASVGAVANALARMGI